MLRNIIFLNFHVAFDSCTANGLGNLLSVFRKRCVAPFFFQWNMDALYVA